MTVRLTRPMKETARLLSMGMDAQQIARQLNCREEKVLAWMQDPRVMDLFRQRILQSQIIHYARAVERIGAMLEDENAAVVQRSAHEVLKQFEDAALRMSGQETIVRVEGMPELGMPEGPLSGLSDWAATDPHN